MTNEELVFQAQNGDQESYRLLYQRCERLLSYYAAKYASNQYHWDELRSCANLAFVKAVNKFDKKRKTKFVSYMSICIRNEILAYMRSNAKHNAVVSLYNVVPIDDGESSYLIDSLRDDKVSDLFDEFYEDRFKLCINDCLDVRDQLDKSIIHHLQTTHINQTQMAKLLGVTQPTISRRIKRMRNSIEQKINAL